jgi:hypothetical protein
MRINPFLGPEATASIKSLSLCLMLHINRIGAAERARTSVNDVRKALYDLGQSANDAGLMRQLEQNQQALIGWLTTSRGYVNSSGGFDPRMLVFEYCSNIVLRQSQVELINQFLATALTENKSCVSQMIMGAGKTTVIAPLLALMLADGKRAVFQVVPTPLLEMSRNVMRCRFSSLLCKRIQTFQFDRSQEVTPLQIQRLFAKLDSVRTSAGIVVSTPDAVKSFQLKSIELLQLAIKLYNPSAGVACFHLVLACVIFFNLDVCVCAGAVVDARDTVLAANSLATQQEMNTIFRIWKDGYLLLDEVDMLLHPLRSELNFPIGQKIPLDLSPKRWYHRDDDDDDDDDDDVGPDSLYVASVALCCAGSCLCFCFRSSSKPANRTKMISFAAAPRPKSLSFDSTESSSKATILAPFKQCRISSCWTRRSSTRPSSPSWPTGCCCG